VSPPPSSLAGIGRAELEERVRALGEPPWRAAQVFSWVQRHAVDRYDAMTNVPARLRTGLAAWLPVRGSTAEERLDGADGTTKLLIGLRDGARVECVLIPEGERRTACISTQVGCGVGCVFCASGARGVVRNLDAAEIVEQVHHLRALDPAPLTNVVVMGMGEPLHNVGPLVDALTLLQHPEGVDLGARRITVSTSGPRRGFDSLRASGLRCKLAISLHAPFDDLRRQLVPRGGSGSVAELVAMADAWFDATGRDVTFEYVLLDGLNDSDDHARALARLCTRHRNLNLIPMNPVPFAPSLRAPPRARVEAFAALLQRAGVVVHLRRQRGDDVAAACGQLRLAAEERPAGQTG